LDDLVFTEFRVLSRDDGYLVMLKGTRLGKKKVAWFHAATYRDAMVLVATSIDSGHADWLLDKPRKRRAR
jgi:hypothetical protein